MPDEYTTEEVAAMLAKPKRNKMNAKRTLYNGHWYAKTGRLHAKAVDFGDDDLALVRALCHAIGIEVGDG